MATLAGGQVQVQIRDLCREAGDMKAVLESLLQGRGVSHEGGES